MVAEADQPYCGYYGQVPEKSQPNSLFLFTERYYDLVEALCITQNIDICTKHDVDVGSAVFLFQNQRVPAIRIRNFPDYNHIKMLQSCYIGQGVKFSAKVHLEREAIVTVNKCFFLEAAEEGIFFDKKEKNEGYITISKYPGWPDFEILIENTRNNSNCMLFDAAMGSFIIEGHVENIIRIYSGHLDLKLLKCIKNEIQKWI